MKSNLIVLGCILVFCSCQTAPVLNTASMKGQSYKACVEQYKLDDYEIWATPNLPPGEDGEFMYLMEEGNLTLTVNNDQKITSAEFTESHIPQKERLQEIHKAWSKFVDAHTIKRK